MIKAKKSLGQNFLQDEGVLQDIVIAAELNPDDHVLEVGPGKAALTRELLNYAGQVTAVELDDRLIPLLEEEFGKEPNFTLIHADALTTTPPASPYKLVANIPYYITSPLLNHFLKDQFEEGNPPTLMVLMVQREVAEKIIAAPDKKGRRKHSVLSLQVHLFAEPELVCIVPPEAFHPAPKVDSAVIKIRVNKKPQANLKNLFWLFHVGFAQKRKKLSKNLSNGLKTRGQDLSPKDVQELLETLNIDPNARAEHLSLEEWYRLEKALAKD